MGPPNAGKSSIMNALAKRPAAIVSPIAGTTRDIVEVCMDLAGVSCVVSDTAGLRDSTDDPIELEGIKRARDAFRRAHLKVFVGDASDTTSIKLATSMLKAMNDSSTQKEKGQSPDVCDGGAGNGGDASYCSCLTRKTSWLITLRVYS